MQLHLGSKTEEEMSSGEDGWFELGAEEVSLCEDNVYWLIKVQTVGGRWI